MTPGEVIPPLPDEAAVQTVLGQILAAELGTTLVHEHLLVDIRCNWRPDDDPTIAFRPVTTERLGRIRANPFACRDNLVVDEPHVLAEELKRYRDAGGDSIVDATPPGLGRDARVLEWLAAESGVNIVAGCGFYVEVTHPARLHGWSVEDIAGEMIRDLTEGMDGTGIKAGVIGELGVTRYPMGPAERKVFQAAALAQQEVGCAIIAHSAAGADSPLEVIEVLSDAGAEMSRVVQSHLDDRFRTDLDLYRRAGELGAGFGLDTFGRELYYSMRESWLASDEERVDALIMLIEAGMTEHVFPAQDICFKHELATYGGHGYDHFLRYIVPRLAARGVSGADLDTLLRKNPARLLAGPFGAHDCG
ncbi:MAG: hypothetical protein J4G11_06930 [Acidimicrobiia bacterium]|nr:hypothetical protein [Acidimicrobiia bacterium]